MNQKNMTLLRDNLVKAMIFHAGLHGWGRTSLLRAAEDIDISTKEALRAFPDTAARDIIAHMHHLGDRKLQEDLARHDLNILRIREKITLGVRLRLEPWVDARDSLKRAIPVMMSPLNSTASAKMIYETVDIIWRAAGDVSVDINFYSKRSLLTGVYLSTLLYWLNDPSEHQEESWQFLERRITQAMTLGQKAGQVSARCSERLGPAFAAFFRAESPFPRNFSFSPLSLFSALAPLKGKFSCFSPFMAGKN